MKKSAIFASLIFGFLLLININFTLGWNIGNVGDYFHCSDSDGKDYQYTSDTKEGEGTTTTPGNHVGTLNVYEKGQTYGKLKISDSDFVTMEDSCVMTELNQVSDEELKIQDTSIESGKISRDENNLIRGYNGLDNKWNILTCKDENCSSAKIEECVGKNCGAIEYGCSTDFDFFDFLMYSLKHPTVLFDWSQKTYNVDSTLFVCENGCTQGVCTMNANDEGGDIYTNALLEGPSSLKITG